jgi:YidC/Oxa1 family membrane protein insertase
VENALYRVEFSNRGAVVKSWKLKKYLDDAKPQRTLDLVHAEASQQTGGWPFSLVLEDPQLETQVNAGLYTARTAKPTGEFYGKVGEANAALYVGPEAAPVESAMAGLQAPAQLSFAWSDGQTVVTKTFTFDHSYVVLAQASVRQNGQPLTTGLAWHGGFGDLTVANPVPVEQVTVFYDAGGKLNVLPHKNLKPADEVARNAWTDGNTYAGIEDRYFAAAFLPPQGAPSKSLAVRYWKLFRDVQSEGKTSQEPVAEVAVGTGAPGPDNLRVYVGPKDYDDLKSMNPPLQDLVQFGYLEFIAAPLFHVLKWMHPYIPNWGWAIVALTLAINMLLFPLKVKSYRSMQRMQKVAPEIKQIQARYKKYKMRDPRKTEMQKEIMAVYQREGINPMGGCLPMALQMPIWLGLYRMLGVTIELRHAPWLGWIHDLSAKDPYYILPVVMGITMYLMQKMTPMTATDPSQQTMMKLMPLMFAGMFVVVPVSSGLVLYILTSNLVGMGQQWYLNRTHPMTASQPPKGKRK